MTRLDKIKHDIQNLSEQDLVKLQKWFADLDWEKWDEQLEKDAAQGKFDILIEEAMAAKPSGKVTTHHDLDFLVGTRSEEDLKEFEEATAYFGQVDEELWSDHYSD